MVQHKIAVGFFGSRWRRTAALLALAIGFALTATPSTQAQTFTVLHMFTGGQDGALPVAGLTIDQAGNLYGTTSSGGYMGNDCGTLIGGCGTVFKLARKGSGWVTTPLYEFTGSFAGGSDGAEPQTRVDIGRDGSLYGTTFYGGGAYDQGTVFNLKPASSACKTALCPWTETVLHSFAGAPLDAGGPLGDPVFDQAGNIYGTTLGGGSGYDGAAYELLPSNGRWTESLLYSFTGNTTAVYSGVILDKQGNLYGALENEGAYGYGAVYELTPSGAGWTETLLYSLLGGDDGAAPRGGLIFDASGNLYGGASEGGSGSGGTVFQLTPQLGGGWTYTVLYSFSAVGNHCGSPGPVGSLTLDAVGNLYGATECDGAYGYGSIFKLSPENGGWVYTSLHDFTGDAGGARPNGGLVFDASGNLYGTTSAGGANGYQYGVVFEISP